jgi:predicted PurR-regulated permease PerM
MSTDNGDAPQQRSRDYWTPGRIAVAALIIAGVAWAVFRGSSILAEAAVRLAHVFVTLVLAVALAYVVWPVVIAFERLLRFLPPRLRRVVSALLVIVGFLGLIVFVIIVTAAPLLDESKRLGGLIQQWAAAVPGWVERMSAQYGKALSADDISALRDNVIDWTTSFFKLQGDILKAIALRGWYIVELFIVPVLAFYFVTDGAALGEQIVNNMPARRRARVRIMGAEMNALLHSYVRAQVVLCFTMAVVTSLLLYFAGLRVYLTLGLLAGACWAVPILGPVVAAVPIALFSALQSGPEAALLILLAYTLLNMTQTKIVMPRVLSAGARLHPVFIIVAILIGAQFLGVIGAFIAVPTAAILRVIVSHLRDAAGRPDQPPLP